MQGVYYLITALWPILSIRSFELVTGKKTDHLITGRDGDHWLVMTVSVLILAVAITLLLAAYRRTHTLEIAMLGITAAVGLCAIDIIYTARNVISWIYLFDAALEIPLVFAWAITIAVNSPFGAEGKSH